MSCYFTLVLVHCFLLMGHRQSLKPFVVGPLLDHVFWCHPDMSQTHEAGPPLHASVPPNKHNWVHNLFKSLYVCVCLFGYLITWSCVQFLLLHISLLGVQLWLCCDLCVRVCIDVCICGRGCKSACMRLCTVWPLSVKVESSAEAYGRPQPSPRHLTIELHLQEKPSETK